MLCFRDWDIELKDHLVQIHCIWILFTNSLKWLQTLPELIRERKWSSHRISISFAYLLLATFFKIIQSQCVSISHFIFKVDLPHTFRFSRHHGWICQPIITDRNKIILFSSFKYKKFLLHEDLHRYLEYLEKVLKIRIILAEFLGNQIFYWFQKLQYCQCFCSLGFMLASI